MDMKSLNGDLITDILGRVDGLTLANAGCVSSHFCSIATQESLWEEKCCSLWPSSENKDVKELISSSVGGFRNFYANCFPFIAYDESCERDSTSNELKGACDVFPSDIVSVVDVAYKNKVIYSKVVWGIPDVEDFEGWFCKCPFRIDLINFDEDHTITDELPTIVAVDVLSKGAKFNWGQFMENIKLSWIVINRRTGQAANLSSWSPLVGQRRWPSDKDYVICFGSILPADSILPCKTVQCKFVMKCRVSHTDLSSLKITELGMQLEDIMGGRVNGRNSLIILQRALPCRRSKNHIKILEFHKKYLAEQSKLKEAKMRREGCVDTLIILSGIVAFASVWCFIF